MNLTKFLECVDNSAKDMSKEELKRFIHEIAREYPEEKRNHFLGKLEKVQVPTEADKKEKRENFVDKNFCECMNVSKRT